MAAEDVVVAQVMRLFGDRLGELAERVGDLTEAAGPGYPGEDVAGREEQLAAGAAGLRKLLADRADELTGAELTGLEAIILLEGRPALFVRDGDFTGVPERWRPLTAHREAIRASIARVGRIEVTGHPQATWIGTGFVAGPRALLTCRHVAREFARPGWGSGWRFRPGMTASLDFNQEIDATWKAEFAITGIAGIHDRHDLAVLTIEQTGGAGQPLPAPLPVAAAKPGAVTDRTVYVIGYPGWDGMRNDDERMREIFGDTFGVKRLQPGLLTSWDDGGYVLTHDCSTLGGNSGSPVIDLETHQVIGVHFSGTYLASNLAVPLWQLTGDELLRKTKVNFV